MDRVRQPRRGARRAAAGASIGARAGRAAGRCDASAGGQAVSAPARSGCDAGRRRLDARPLALPARPDRCIVGADGDAGRGRRVASSAPGRASRPCSTSWSASCRCCAPTCRGRRGDARAARPGRAAHGRGVPPARADGRFITPMAAVAGSVAEELIAAFADERIAPRLDQQRRRHRAASRAGRSRYSVGLCRRSRAPAASAPASTADFERRCRIAGARHRHQRLARPQLLARHRRQRDRARRDGGGGRCGGDDDRQRGRRRRCAASFARRRASSRTTATSAIASSRVDVPPLPERLVERRWSAAPARRGRRSAPGASSRRCSRCKAAGASSATCGRRCRRRLALPQRMLELAPR